MRLQFVLPFISVALAVVVDRDVIIAPSQKIVWCAIEKVASATVRTLVSDLNEKGGEHAVKKIHNQALNFGWTSQRYQEVLDDQTWRKVLFVRDPVARFISGWSSKCNPGHDADRGHCEQAFGAINVTLLEAIDSLVECSKPVATTPAWKKRCSFWQGHPERINLHWRPQVHFCGGFKQILPKFQAVEELSGNVTQKILTVLRQAGVQEPERLPSLARIIDVEARSGKHYSQLPGSHMTHSSGSMLDAHPDKRAIIEKFYEEDYRMFRQRGLLKAGSVSNHRPSIV